VLQRTQVLPRRLPLGHLRSLEGSHRGQRPQNPPRHICVCRGRSARLGPQGTQFTCFTSTNVQILTQKAQALEYRGAGTVTNFDPALYASDDAAALPPRPRSLDDEHALDAYTEHELANDDALEAHQSTRNPPAPQHNRAKLSSISAAAAADRKRCRLLSTSPCPSELSGPEFFLCWCV